MRRLCLLALLLGSCTAEPPEPVVVKKSPPKTVPSPTSEPKPARAVPDPLPLPPPSAPEPLPPEPELHRVNLDLVLEPAPKQDTDPGKIHLPAFTIRTMDHEKVDVGVNGYRHATTSCLWSVCEGMEFDRKIAVPEWPPRGAKYVGATKQKGGTAEVYIEANAPGLKSGEHVLYVKGTINGAELLGALRLYVGKPGLPYRYTNFNPAMNMESEEASKFARTMWFEPTKN